MNRITITVKGSSASYDFRELKNQVSLERACQDGKFGQLLHHVRPMEL